PLMRNLRYGLQEKSAHRFNTLADILSKIARKVSKNRKFKLNQQALFRKHFRRPCSCRKP
ncbi:hypothetical protein, partial [Eisenbergiella porci]|uniref:hypothetical protein n=1 Tax=Eisenbergiella porci TaxID=2652274 RepID=UPI002A912224